MFSNISVYGNQIFEAISSTSKNSYIYLCDMWNDMSRWSPTAVEYFGLPSEYMENAGAIWESHIHPEDRARYRDEIEAVFAGEKTEHDIEYRAMDKNGNYVVCSSIGKVINDEEGRPSYFVGTITNHGIVDNYDPTTGLYNLYEFLKSIGMIREKYTSYRVLLLGISHFSDINDVYGYSFGNEVMKVFAGCVKDVLNGSCQVYRMDGTRFAICSVNRSLDEMKSLYTDIQDMAKKGFNIKGVNVPITICGGVVDVTDMSINEHAVYTAARYAQDTSKKEKYGELVIVGNDELKGKENSKTVKLISVLRNSVLNNCRGFYMVYQPVVSADTMKLTGMEALLRWNGEPYGEVPPGLFIPWLEKDKVFFELSNWILRNALLDGKDFLQDHPDITMNVNLSYAQLERSEFRSTFISILESTGFPPEHLCLEITERCRFLDIKFLRNEVMFLKGYGIKIALDDFGTGFSSLDLLRELPVDVIKIDRSFVVDIERNTTRSIVRALTNCAAELDVAVCMEGIEDEETLKSVQGYYTTTYQGYMFSSPVPREQFKKLKVYK